MESALALEVTYQRLGRVMCLYVLGLTLDLCTPVGSIREGQDVDGRCCWQD